MHGWGLAGLVCLEILSVQGDLAAQVETDLNIATGLDITASVGHDEEWLERFGTARRLASQPSPKSPCRAAIAGSASPSDRSGGITWRGRRLHGSGMDLRDQLRNGMSLRSDVSPLAQPAASVARALRSRAISSSICSGVSRTTASPVAAVLVRRTEGRPSKISPIVRA